MSSELSRWRLEKAEQTFREGKQLLEAGSCNGAINRFYYAAFHAARALLATKRLDSAKHSGVISLFNREFVKPGLISKEASTTLSALFSMRAEADYDDFKSFSLEEAERAKEAAKSLIEEVRGFLLGDSP